MGEKRVIEQVASDEIYNDDWFLKDSVLHDTTKVQPSVIKEYVNQGMATSQNLADEATARQNMDNQLASGISKQMSNLADFYDTTKSYVVGDVCVLPNGELKRCIAPTSGAFDNTKWEPVTVDELFDDLNFSADAISYDNETSGLEADNVQDAIDETITKLSAVGTASGDIATFTDGSDLPMPKLEVAIEPVQSGSGDPSPTNIRPIIGWSEVNVGVVGKNLFDATNLINDRTIDTNGDLSGYGGRVATPNYIPVKPNTSICLSYSKTVSQNLVFIYALYKDGTLISRVANNPMGAVIQTENANQIRFAFYDSVSASDLYNIQLEYGNTATSYEPYNPNSTTITLDLDGTRYGGKVDLVSGVMTLTHGFADLGTVNWDKYTSSTKTYFRTSAQLPDAKKSDSPSTTHNLMCSNYKEDTWSHVIDGIGYDGNICIGWSNNAYIGIYDSRYVDTSVSDFKTAMNGVQLVYELATPLTIQLTPTQVKSLLGSNNVWADTGDILDAKYVRDLTTIINYILEQLNA